MTVDIFSTVDYPQFWIIHFIVFEISCIFWDLPTSGRIIIKNVVNTLDLKKMLNNPYF